MREQNNNAILLMRCKDHKGIVAAVTDFLLKNDGNIINLDQHVDDQEQLFFMRVEWDLNQFAIPEEKIGEFFETLIAKKFNMDWRINFCCKKPRIAIFVSKYSHCFFDVLSRYESGDWQVEIPLIISNHNDFKHIADRLNIPYYHIPITKANKKEQEAYEIKLLKDYNIDLVILARYMQILTNDIIKHYRNKIINIHHSSLPAFPGANPYKSAYNRGVKFMGATAHYVTAELDAGPIIAQDLIRITHKDSIRDLKRKGQDIEKIVFSKAIWSHINHSIITYNNKTVVF